MGLFGGSSKTYVTQQQDIHFKPTTNVEIDTEGLGVGVANLGQSIQQGISDQQDILNFDIDLFNDEIANRLTIAFEKISENFKIVLIGGALVAAYFYFKHNKGLKNGKFKIHLPKIEHLLK